LIQLIQDKSAKLTESAGGRRLWVRNATTSWSSTDHRQRQTCTNRHTDDSQHRYVI